MRRVISFCFLLEVIAGCTGSQDLHPAAFLQYYGSAQPEGVRTVEFQDAEYRVRFVPASYFALSECVQGGSRADEACYQSRLGQIKGNTYFIIEIKASDGAAKPDPAAKEKLVSYYMNEVADNMRLSADGSQSLAPAYVNYEDSYGLSPFEKLVVCFNYDLAAVQSELRLEYEDRLLGNPGIKASFDKKEIDRLPVLTF